MTNTMPERFDKRFDICDNPDHGFINAMVGVETTDIGRLGCPVCGGKFNNPKLFVPSELKDFIQSEIDLAVAKREKEIVERIQKEMDRINDGDIKYIGLKKSINLITTK